MNGQELNHLVRLIAESGHETIQDAVEGTLKPDDFEQYVFTGIEQAHAQLMIEIGPWIEHISTAIARATLADQLSSAGLPDWAANLIGWHLCPKILLPTVELTAMVDAELTELESGENEVTNQ